MAAISRDEVANLARLARISMSDAELDHLAGEMDVILGAVARVQEVAGADVPPTSHPLAVSNVMLITAAITPTLLRLNRLHAIWRGLRP